MMNLFLNEMCNRIVRNSRGQKQTSSFQQKRILCGAPLKVFPIYLLLYRDMKIHIRHFPL